jgi:3-methyladenine DNA glycosylase AlkD
MAGRMGYAEVMAELESMADPEAAEGMAHFGVRAKAPLGLTMPQIRGVARRAGRDHALAARLWASGIHEARILAGLVDVPSEVTQAQMDAWVRDFDSWDVCDQVCMSLFDRTPWAYEKAVEWAGREEEYVRRAGFAMMATLAVHDKEAPDARFLALLPVIERHAGDDRNFVKKAVNWALRQIGKRDAALNRTAIAAAGRIRAQGSKAARWVAADALRELGSEAVQARLRSRKGQRTTAKAAKAGRRRGGR